MNLIKFKDSIHPTDDLFNTYLKGKYAYWIQMRYVVPFECLDTKDYVLVEQNPNLLFDKNSNILVWDMLDPKSTGLEAWINESDTEVANSIVVFERSNSFATDSDITTSEVKKFRTWLATCLLELDQDGDGNQLNSFFDENFTHVLQYYANGMYDDVVKWLNEFGREEYQITNRVGKSTCSCGSSSTNLSSLYNSEFANCDSLVIYRKNIYQAMVDKFGDYSFWEDIPYEFIAEIKQYVDNILNLGLLLETSTFASDYEDCICSSGSCSQNECSVNKNVLTNFSIALGYIVGGETNGNKNFIGDAFNDWAIILYEQMEWS